MATSWSLCLVLLFTCGHLWERCEATDAGGVDRLIVDAEDATVEIAYEAEKAYEDRAQFCDK